MGTFTHAITLHSADGDYTETLDAPVGTGSTFTSMPSPVLERLGIQPRRTIRLRLANGRTEERAIGRVLADLEGETEVSVCVYAAPEAPAVIGAVTLELFLLGTDPVEKRLVPIEAMWV